MRPLYILSILAFYVFVQFCWWSYLLVELNNEVNEHKIENVRLRAASPEDAEREIQQLYKQNNQKHWMVLGEGSVFLALLAWGSIMTARALRKEVTLARQQKNFLLSITHEFKSPLASIKLYLQTILRHDLDKEKEKSFINSAINDTERLNNLVENALLANQVDHNGYSFSMEEVNFSALVRLIVQKYQVVPDQHKLESQIEEGVSFLGDKNALTLLLTNLIENAFKYSAKEEPVSVVLETVENKIRLSIKDRGMGIPDAEKERIFQKFYRIGNEETRKSKGTGLGLFIVRYIVKGHNGLITVQDNSPKGTIFCVEFPTGSANP